MIRRQPVWGSVLEGRPLVLWLNIICRGLWRGRILVMSSWFGIRCGGVLWIMGGRVSTCCTSDVCISLDITFSYSAFTYSISLGNCRNCNSGHKRRWFGHLGRSRQSEGRSCVWVAGWQDEGEDALLCHNSKARFGQRDGLLGSKVSTTIWTSQWRERHEVSLLWCYIDFDTVLPETTESWNDYTNKTQRIDRTDCQWCDVLLLWSALVSSLLLLCYPDD